MHTYVLVVRYLTLKELKNSYLSCIIIYSYLLFLFLCLITCSRSTCLLTLTIYLANFSFQIVCFNKSSTVEAKYTYFSTITAISIVPNIHWHTFIVLPFLVKTENVSHI